jgi:hypothetical protein
LIRGRKRWLGCGGCLNGDILRLVLKCASHRKVLR